MASHPPDPQVARIAVRLSNRLDALSDALVEVIATEIDLYGDGVLVGRDRLQESVMDNLTYMVNQLTTSDEPDLTAPRRTGKERADQTAPLPEVLRAFRLGFAFLWRELLAEARAMGVDALNALLDTATSIWELADDYSIALTSAYRQRVSEHMVAADRRRSVLVESLISGAGSGQGSAWEIAKLLEFPFEGTFLVLAVDAPIAGPDVVTDLEDRLRDLPLMAAWRANPERQIGVFSCGQRETGVALADALGSHVVHRVGISPMYDRLDRTQLAARYAQIALETIPAGHAEVHRLADDPLSELVISNLGAARRMVQRVLGGVLTLSSEDRKLLLTTAQAWIDADGSAEAAGRVLYCHKNTVRHRMHRLEDHIGHSVDTPQAVAELTAALLAIRAFPSLTTSSDVVTP